MLRFILGGRRTSASDDPFLANTVLLLNMEGDEGSSVFVDSSIHGTAIAAYGNASTSGGYYRNGRKSALLDGVSYLVAPASTGLYSFPADFTVETWVRLTSYSAIGSMIFDGAGIGGSAQRPTSFALGIKNSGYLYISSDNVEIVDVTTQVSLDTWHHVAVARYATTFLVFLDGTLAMYTTLSTNFIAGGCVIGTDGTAAGIVERGLVGRLDIFRITSGVARYLSQFDPTVDVWHSPWVPTVATSTTASTDLLSQDYVLPIPEHVSNHLELTGLIYIDSTQETGLGFTGEEITANEISLTEVGYVDGIVENDYSASLDVFEPGMAVDDMYYIIGVVDYDACVNDDNVGSDLTIDTIAYIEGVAAQDFSSVPEGVGGTIAITSVRYLGGTADIFGCGVDPQYMYYGFSNVDVDTSDPTEGLGNAIEFTHMDYASEGPTERIITLDEGPRNTLSLSSILYQLGFYERSTPEAPSTTPAEYSNTITLSDLSYTTGASLAFDNTGTPEVARVVVSLAASDYYTGVTAFDQSAIEIGQVQTTASFVASDYYDGWLVFNQSVIEIGQVQTTASFVTSDYFDGIQTINNSGTPEVASVTISFVSATYT